MHAVLDCASCTRRPGVSRGFSRPLPARVITNAYMLDIQPVPALLIIGDSLQRGLQRGGSERVLVLASRPAFRIRLRLLVSPSAIPDRAIFAESSRGAQRG